MGPSRRACFSSSVNKPLAAHVPAPSGKWIVRGIFVLGLQLDLRCLASSSLMLEGWCCSCHINCFINYFEAMGLIERLEMM